MTYLNGIDISNMERGLDIKNIDADFVIIKATVGVREKDDCFENWVEDAISDNKKIGIYHYAIGNVKAEEEALFFWENVKQYCGKGIFILNWIGKVVDRGPSYAKEFLDEFYKISGKHCLIRMDKETIKKYDWEEVKKDYKLWVIDCPNNNPTQYHYVEQNGEYDPWDEAIMRQYSRMGIVKGYPAPLNINCFYGEKEDWDSLLENKKFLNEKKENAIKVISESKAIVEEKNNTKGKTSKVRKSNQYKKTTKK